MDKKTKQRIALTSIVLLLILANLVLFSTLTRLSQELTTGSTTIALSYSMLGAIVLLSLLLMGYTAIIIRQNAQQQKKLQAIENEKQALLDHEEKKKEEERESRKTVNYKSLAGEYLGRILPGVEMAPEQMAEKSLANLAQELQGVQGIFYTRGKNGQFTPIGTFAYVSDQEPKNIESGTGIGGQAVKSNEIVHISQIPENYLDIITGLGKSQARELLFIPLNYKDECIALIEMALFKPTDEETLNMLDEFRKLFGRTYAKALKEKEIQNNGE